MSKRFGRNQKRRMRAQIAELELRTHKAEKRQRVALAQGERDRQAVIDTARVLGDYFATLPPVTIELQHLNELFERRRIPKLEKMPDYFTPYYHPEELVVESMEVLELAPTLVEEITDHYGMQQQFRVVREGRTIAAFGMTLQAYHNTPRPMLARMIGEQLGEFIANRETLT